MTVAELEDRMSSAELTKWMAFDKEIHDQRRLAEMRSKTQQTLGK